MLKNKYAQYILVPIVLIVWGLIFYRVYQAISGGAADFLLPPNPFVAAAETAAVSDEYQLLLHYKDPFLGKKGAGKAYQDMPRNANDNYSNPTPSTARNNAAQNRPYNPQPGPAKADRKADMEASKAVDNLPPTVVYQGYQVFQEDTVALLNVDSRFYANVRRGELLENIQIDGIFRDSLRFWYGGRRHSARLKK